MRFELGIYTISEMSLAVFGPNTGEPAALMKRVNGVSFDAL